MADSADAAALLGEASHEIGLADNHLGRASVLLVKASESGAEWAASLIARCDDAAADASRLWSDLQVVWEAHADGRTDETASRDR